MGAPGDAPFSDIMTHGRNLIGDGVDDEIRTIVGQFPRLAKPIAEMIIEQGVQFGTKQSFKQRSIIREYLGRMVAYQKEMEQ